MFNDSLPVFIFNAWRFVGAAKLVIFYPSRQIEPEGGPRVCISIASPKKAYIINTAK